MLRVLDGVKRVHKFSLALLISSACIAFLLDGSVAQAHDWDIQGTIGAAVPLSDLSDVTDPGVAFGLGLTRWANKWVGFHLGAAANLLGGKDSAPDLTLLHYNAGAEFDLIDPATSNVRLHANVGLGGTTTTAKDLDSSTDFTINGGPNLEYKFSERWNGLVGTQLYVILADDTQVVLPVYVGFRYAFLD